MMNKQTEQFLKEVALELANNKITNPTPEQIAEAMTARIHRQGDLYSKLFGHTWHGPSAQRAKDFLCDLSASVYREVRQ